MSQDVLSEQQRYLAQLLEAIQRCAWFLHQSRKKVTWPLDGDWLADHKHYRTMRLRAALP